MSTQRNTPDSIRPFTVDVAQTDVDDLMERLARTRLPQPAPGDDWVYGVPNSYLRDVIDEWTTSFDWRAQEARMNEFAHYLTEIDGRTVHFLHIPSKETAATPLLLVHTYPGSFVDFLDMIGPLVDPVAHGGRAEDACSVVIPSVPGFGFSEPVDDPGWTLANVAAMFDTLMRRLGYDRYGVHGSDCGALVARELGLMQPDGFLGLHVLQLFSFPSGDPAEFENLTPAEYAGLAHMEWFQSVGGYNAINASRPQTIAVGISDSPAGQLAWNELFMSFGNGTSRVSTEQILTEVSLEWFTNTSSSAGRYHYEEARAQGETVINNAPTGVAVFADDFQTIKVFAERDNSNIVHWSTFEGGGHYASLEAPDVLAGDIRTFFAGRRQA
jgi:pimeloyl-ACP methyl ester carboxylesterase